MTAPIDTTCTRCEGTGSEPGEVIGGVAFAATRCPDCWGEGFVRRDTTAAAA